MRERRQTPPHHPDRHEQAGKLIGVALGKFFEGICLGTGVLAAIVLIDKL